MKHQASFLKPSTLQKQPPTGRSEIPKLEKRATGYNVIKPS